MDVVVWLRSLGLQEYEAAFRDNKINERVLPNLTQEDLKEIGVDPVGHRRILLDAIVALRAEGGVKAPSPAAAPAGQSARPPSAESVAQAAGERRYLTVLFCDLVGSTSISARLDADWLRSKVPHFRDCSGIIIWAVP